MYQPGDLIIYGGEGVCRVEAIAAESFMGWLRDGGVR